MTLQDDRLLDVVPEAWWNVDDPPPGGITPTVTMITLFPSLIIQQQVNSLSTRHIVPRGPGEFDFVWTHFGFADDSARDDAPPPAPGQSVRAGRFCQSADDGEVIAMVQQAFAAHGQARTVSELDGFEVKATEHMVTETLIRGMYAYWRGVMGL